MDQNQINAAYDMLYLASCAVNEIVPEQSRLSAMDFESVYNFSKIHQLSAMTYMALESAFKGELPSDPIISEWGQSKDKALRKQLLFDAEYAKISSFMEQRGIWHLPLKGMVLKKLYPKIGMREMSDIDIYYDRTFRDDVIGFFSDNGYTVHLENGHHDEFTKEPVYNVEMHKELFSQTEPLLYDFFSAARDRLLPTNSGKSEHRLSDSDLFIYVTAHEFKHYSAGGTGLRSLVDIYLFLRRKSDDLDFDYINKELSSIGILEFSQSFISLSDKVLGSPMSFDVSRLSENETEQLNYILFSGAYGTLANRIKNKMTALSPNSVFFAKVKYVFSRLFPDMNFIKTHHPFVAKHKILLPFFYVYRIIRNGIKNFKKHLVEAKTLKKL